MNQESRRLHVVGCPRSGTTLLMELMHSCFENEGYCDHEVSIFTPPPVSSNLYLSKKPTDILYVKELLEADQQLFVISLYRDPRSVLSSIHRSNKSVYFSNYTEWKRCQDAAESLEGHDRFLLVQYERLTAFPCKVQKLIETKFPFLVKKHSFSEYTAVAKPSEKSKNALNGVRPISTKRHEEWKNHLPRVKSEIERHPAIKKELVRLNYEMNDDWLESLTATTSKRFPCRATEHYNTLKKMETKVRKYFQIQRYKHKLK